MKISIIARDFRIELSTGDANLNQASFFSEKQFGFSLPESVGEAELEYQFEFADDNREGTDFLARFVRMSRLDNNDVARWCAEAASLLNDEAPHSKVWRHFYAGSAYVPDPLSTAFLKATVPRRIVSNDQLEFEAYAFCFDSLCDRLNYGKEIIGLCGTELSLNGASYWHSTNVGHCAYRSEHQTTVSDSYRKAALLANGRKVIHFNRGIFSWPQDDDLERVEGCDPLTLLSLVTEAPFELAINVTPTVDGLVHFVGCDDGYFRKFFSYMVLAMLSGESIGTVLHFHISNPSQATREALLTLSKQDNFRINWSFDFPNKIFCRSEYYTCIRFIFAPKIKEYMDSRVLITDVDIAPQGGWTKLNEVTAGKICGFRFHGSMSSIFDYKNYFGVPWSVNAQMVYFGRNPVAKNVLEFQSKYILYKLSSIDFSRGSFWTIDQVALRVAIDNALPRSLSHEVVNLSLYPLMARAPKDLSAGTLIDFKGLTSDRNNAALRQVSYLLRLGQEKGAPVI